MIISASIRTDIPSYFSDWFLNRLKQGYVLVKNPMNPHQVSQVSLSQELVDCFVFWSKNPAPMFSRLSLLQPYMYYFQYTLNPYGTDIETGLPSLSERLETFHRFSQYLIPSRMVWRYDPILLSPDYTVSWHLEQFGSLARQLKDYTDTCMVSFLDLYSCNKKFLHTHKIETPDERIQAIIAEGFSSIARDNHIRLATCCETIDLDKYDIDHGSCIDKRRIEKLLGSPLKIPSSSNKRPGCQCVTSIDIGTYHTCSNGCGYCYANHSPLLLSQSKKLYDCHSPILCSVMDKSDVITLRKMTPYFHGQIGLTLE